MIAGHPPRLIPIPGILGRMRLSGRLARFIHRVPNPTFAGGVTGTFLLLAFWFAVVLKHNGVFFVVCGLVGTVLSSIVVTGLAVGKLTVARTLPARVFAGQSFSVRLKVKNRGRFLPALGLHFRDALQSRAADQVAAGPTLFCLPPRRETVLLYEGRVHRRGVYPIDYALAATRFPFGLFEAQRLVRSPGRIIVWPALGRLRRHARLELARRSPQASGRAIDRQRQTEFYGIREFRSGDNPRHIHWRTSARTQTLMRRELHGDASPHMTIVLDTFVGGPDAEIRRRYFERAVSLAATLLVDAARNRRPVVLVHAGGRITHMRGSTTAALDRLATIAGGHRTVDTIFRSAIPRAGSVLVISLHGRPGGDAWRSGGVRAIVWDVSSEGFGRYFQKHQR